ncbi:purine permease 21 [Quercus suber]|uniref:Purine permease 21 n=1 Tax=Quercus suber TaxID=58331 RepID=A0AAW0JQQ3_QUESU
MDGVKAISMVLAIWGFISYFYQYYLDDSESKAEKRDVKEEISTCPLLKEFKKLKKQTHLVISMPPANQQSLNPKLYAVAPNEHLYTLVLSGQSGAILLGRFYHDKGGKSKWTATLVQLTFNAFFSFLINSQKFTPFIINSLVLLTISSALLVFQTNSTSPIGNSNVNYEIGLFCTVGASAGFGLMFSLTELSFHKILRRETFISLVAICATLVGLFASGEWKGLKREMDEFELGKFIYVSTLIWTAIASQIFNIGTEGLIHEAEKRDVKEEISMHPLLKEVTDEQDGL